MNEKDIIEQISHDLRTSLKLKNGDIDCKFVIGLAKAISKILGDSYNAIWHSCEDIDIKVKNLKIEWDITVEINGKDYTIGSKLTPADD